MKHHILLGVCICASATGMMHAQPRAPSEPQGVWRLAEEVVTDGNGAVRTDLGPGLLILTASHYSFVRVRGAAQALANWPASQRFNLRITDARLLAPDIAIVETDATFTGADDMANRGTIVAVRDGGRWLIAALRVYPRLIGGGQE